MPLTAEQTKTIEDYAVEQVEEYMDLLLGAGFSIQSVLERGFDYARSYAASNEQLYAAIVVARVAKKLHIDPESQEKQARQSGKASKG